MRRKGKRDIYNVMTDFYKEKVMNVTVSVGSIWF